MNDKKLSFEELVEESELLKDATIEDVETKRGIVSLASSSSEAILSWFEENDATNPDGTPDNETRKYKGLRLIVRSIVNPDGSRLPKERWKGAVELLRRRDSRENGQLMATAFRVNGLRVVQAEETKNVSSEAKPDASHSDSPASSAK